MMFGLTITQFAALHVAISLVGIVAAQAVLLIASIALGYLVLKDRRRPIAA